MDDVNGKMRLSMRGLTLRVAQWVQRVLGVDCLMNPQERALRLVEEAVELAQVEGLTTAEVGRVVDRVFSRPMGEREQEVGGIGVTLLAYCYATDIDFELLTQREVERVERLDPNRIREKHLQKAIAGTAVMALKPGEEDEGCASVGEDGRCSVHKHCYLSRPRPTP
jgi:NTP pyrophosphatase (non-canonical NTP hydrolase)